MFEYMIFAFIVANTIVLGAQVCHLIKGRGSNVTVVYDSFSFDSRVWCITWNQYFCGGEALRVSNAPENLKMEMVTDIIQVLAQ